MEKTLKNNKAITLIALVITIIILLILAGVSIATLTESGLFGKAKYAKDIADKRNGEESLITKIYAYQTTAISKNKIPTLEELKEYLKDDNDIEYMYLYVETASLTQVQVGQSATHAKIKLKEYKHEYILNQKLEIIEYGGDVPSEENPPEVTPPNIKEVAIDTELQALLNEANMQITLEDVLNTPAIMETVTGLIPVITEGDVTREVVDGVITYTTDKGEKIRTSSEDEEGDFHAWRAFDNYRESGACSAMEEAVGYYVEYEFAQNVYATQIKYFFDNGSTPYAGTRTMVVQGYDEANDKWEDLTEELSVSGTRKDTKEVSKNLDYAKAYKKYRFYVKTATYTSDKRGAWYSTMWEMQLYGIEACKIVANTNEEWKKLLLSNSNLDKITLNHMISNKEFIKTLINKLSIETVKNNEMLMANLQSLIPVITGSDVTREVIDGVITYTTDKGEKIRTSSEDDEGDYHGWRAFDNDIESCACSAIEGAVGYYVEYEFAQNVYAMQIKYLFSNGTSYYSGTRTMVVQGYDDVTGEWEDLTEDLSFTGTHKEAEEIIKNLDCTKAYKRYRFYVKTATYTSNEKGAWFSAMMEMQLYGKSAE